MKEIILSERLLSVAGFVRQGAVFADVGTDHAHLPIFLLTEGKISRAVCSDINEGPLALARSNVAAAGLSSSVEFVLTDGASALSGIGITDYAICGMGGELIADIISKAVHLKASDVNLILQPMTKQAHLRKFLYLNGYEVIDELYSTDDGKHYVCLLCKYIGKTEALSDIDAEVGLKSIKNVNISSQISYFKGKIRALKKRIRGLESAQINPISEKILLSALEKRVEALSKFLCGR